MLAPPARELSLAHLTVAEVPPPELPVIAAAAGYRSISLRLNSPRPDVPSPPMLGDTPMRRATRAALRDAGVALYNVEAALLRSDTDVRDYLPLFETSAHLGARGVLVVGLDPDEARLTDRFAKLAEIAARFGLALQLEFMAFSEVKSLAQAVRVVRRSGAPAAGVIIDALHLYRTGGTPADVAALDASLVSSVQLCDGPARIDAARVLDEARGDRGLLGEGVFPLAALMAATPPDAEIALEIPAERLRARGLTPLERATKARQSYRDLFG
jgi:sugar phosphate isomerase/epimerase